MKLREKIWLCGITFLYFSVRMAYWVTHSEPPFSDIADYVRIGQQVVEHWDFAHVRPFWLSYKPPVFPLFLAAYFKVRGSYNLDWWPFFQTVLHFGSLTFFLVKLRQITNRPWVTICCFIIFALSTSSVFWSFKASTEYLSEAFILFITALAIHALQKKSLRYFIMLGVSVMIAILLRPQFMLFLGIFPGLLLLAKQTWRWKLRSLGAFAVAALLTWSPWGIRTYRLYNSPIFTSTQGPYSFLWELGKVEYTTAQGQKAVTDVTQLQMEADKSFKSDFEAMQFANSIAKEWLKKNFSSYLEMIPRRIWNSITDKSEALTHISRNELFPPAVDWILFDKVDVLVVSGIVGLLFVLWWYPALWPACLLPLAQWLMGVAFLGYPRMIDSALPFFYSGNVFLILVLQDFLRRKRQ